MKKRVLVVPWSMDPIYQFLVSCPDCSVLATCVLVGSSTPLAGRVGEEPGIDAIVNGRISFKWWWWGGGGWGGYTVEQEKREVDNESDETQCGRVRV